MSAFVDRTLSLFAYSVLSAVVLHRLIDVGSGVAIILKPSLDGLAILSLAHIALLSRLKLCRDVHSLGKVDVISIQLKTALWHHQRLCFGVLADVSSMSVCCLIN